MAKRAGQCPERKGTTTMKRMVSLLVVSLITLVVVGPLVAQCNRDCVHLFFWRPPAFAGWNPQWPCHQFWGDSWCSSNKPWHRRVPDGSYPCQQMNDSVDVLECNDCYLECPWIPTEASFPSGEEFDCRLWGQVPRQKCTQSIT